MTETTEAGAQTAPLAKRAMAYLEDRRKPLIILGMVATGIATASVAAAGISANGLKERLQAHFPNTKITAVSCKGVVGELCEVVAGRNVFYTTKDARFAIVGSVLDMDKKVDVTLERTKQLAAVGDLEAKIGGEAAAPPTPQPAAMPPAGEGAAPSKINVDLPTANAIVYNRGAKLKVTVISDLNCSFCQKLHAELSAASDIEVTEYPTNLIGGGQKGEMVLCADDRVAAANAAYQGGQVRTAKDCAPAQKAIADNSQKAAAWGLRGTPAVIFADGSVNPGYMPLAEIRRRAEAAQGRPAVN